MGFAVFVLDAGDRLDAMPAGAIPARPGAMAGVVAARLGIGSADRAEPARVTVS